MMPRATGRASPIVEHFNVIGRDRKVTAVDALIVPRPAAETVPVRDGSASLGDITLRCEHVGQAHRQLASALRDVRAL
jgi:urocanate hydratase